MKKTLFLIALIFIVTLTTGAVRKFDIHPIKKFEANPINIAALLTEKNDSASIASICEYYGYRIQPTNDGYTEFRHPNGSTIRYNYTIAEDGKPYSTIKVKTGDSQKNMDKILLNLRFQKEGNTYKRNSFNHQTRCISSHGILEFVNQPKSKK